MNIRRPLIRVAVFCVLVAILVRPEVAHVLAQNTVATQVTQHANDTIAVLFLIDESGGMNRECKGADYVNDVLDVDSQMRLRYAIPRFFMTLFGSVYDSEYGSPYRRDLPRIQVGVAQFSDKFKLVYPFRSVEEVFTTPYLLEARDSDLDPCYTRFASALDSAAAILKDTKAEHLVLILITDGSFRGSEDASWAATKARHTDMQNETGRVLQQIQSDRISTQVFILGSDKCYESNTCGLRQNEYEMRVSDLGRWVEWDNPNHLPGNRLNLLDGRNIVDSIVNLDLGFGVPIQIQASLSGSRIEFPNSLQFTITRSSLKSYINVIALFPIGSNNYLELSPFRTVVDLRRPRPESVLSDRWWRYEVDLPPGQIPSECTDHSYIFKLKQPENSVYIWTTSESLTIDDASLLELFVPAQAVFDNDMSLEVNTKIDLSSEIALFRSSCYKVLFRLLEKDGTVLSESELKSIVTDSGDFSHVFDLASLDCPSRDLVVEVQIIEANTGTVQLEKRKAVSLYFPPMIGAITTQKSADSGLGVSHVITIPIQYGSQVCNPGFEPKFQMVARPNEGKKDGCPSDRDLSPSPDKISDFYEFSVIDQADDKLYVLSLKSWGTDKTYCECGYCGLSVHFGDSLQVTEQYEEFSNPSTSPRNWFEEVFEKVKICFSAKASFLIVLVVIAFEIRSALKV